MYLLNIELKREKLTHGSEDVGIKMANHTYNLSLSLNREKS